MAFAVCANVDAQQKYDELYLLQKVTSTRLTNKEYEAVKEFALKSGNTFHFEYEPTMYAKGVKNQRIGYNILLAGNVTFTVVNGFTWAISTLSDDYEAVHNARLTTIISSCIVGALDIVATCYISVGSKQKNKSAIMVSPNGVKFTF